MVLSGVPTAGSVAAPCSKAAKGPTPPWRALADRGISLDAITAQLLDDGLAAFDADLAKIVESIDSNIKGGRSAA
jgi:hypothetical protein